MNNERERERRDSKPKCPFCKKSMKYDKEKDIWKCQKCNFYKIIKVD